jgi:hypothetical protein
MGKLRSKTNRTGLVVNGVELGVAPMATIDGTPASDPNVYLPDCWYFWDDPAFPNGVVYASGAVDEDEAP